MKSKKAEARRVKKVAPLHWEQQNPAGLSSWWSRGSVCACPYVYVYIALRRVIGTCWWGGFDPDEASQHRFSSALSLALLRAYRQTHPSPESWLEFKHACRAACFTVWMLSRNCGDIIFSSAPNGWLAIEWTAKTFVFGHFVAVWMASLNGKFAPRVFERIITNCETVACRVLLLQTWQFRSGPAGLSAAFGW